MKLETHTKIALVAGALTIGALSPRAARTQDRTDDVVTEAVDAAADPYGNAQEAHRQSQEAHRRAQEDHRRTLEEHRRIQEQFRGKNRKPPIGSLQQIAESAAEIRDAKDEAARAAATKELTNLLDQCFELDMQGRAKELENIAARLQQLQQQLDRRRAKKQEIIDLQVKVAVNEADGLGFFGQHPVGNFNFDIATPVFVTAPQPAAWPTPRVPVTEPATAIPR
jgi:hypothetical protein